MEGTMTLVAILICVLIVAAISQRIQGTVITLPMIYTVLGLLLGSLALDTVDIELDNEIIRIIAEITLVLVLATDASRIHLRRLRNHHDMPIRLLGIGLPLMMILGTITAFFLFDITNFWETAVLAIILAPTDASLGQAVVSNLKVPVRIRQALNVESGLNDGIAMPFLLMALSLAAAGLGSQSPIYWLRIAVTQIGFGVLSGVIIGYLGAHFIAWGKRSQWMSVDFQKLSILALALLAYGIANLIGGNGFIAAFCFGLTAANTVKKEKQEAIYEFAEAEVQGLMLLTFMIVFGAVMLPLAWGTFTWPMLLYALLSLLVVRPLSVGISLLGSKVKPVTIGFLGWFGPRGVASILYLFIVVEEELFFQSQIYSTVMLTVLLSIFMHGITAVPGANWYANHVKNVMSTESAEMREVSEMPLRAHPRKPS